MQSRPYRALFTRHSIAHRGPEGSSACLNRRSLPAHATLRYDALCLTSPLQFWPGSERLCDDMAAHADVVVHAQACATDPIQLADILGQRVFDNDPLLRVAGRFIGGVAKVAWKMKSERGVRQK